MKPLIEITKNIDAYRKELRIMVAEHKKGNCEFDGVMLRKFGILLRLYINWAKRHGLYTEELECSERHEKMARISRLYDAYKQEGKENLGVEERAKLNKYIEVYHE